MKISDHCHHLGWQCFHAPDHRLTAAAYWSDLHNNPLIVSGWIGLDETADLSFLIVHQAADSRVAIKKRSPHECAESAVHCRSRWPNYPQLWSDSGHPALDWKYAKQCFWPRGSAAHSPLQHTGCRIGASDQADTPSPTVDVICHFPQLRT